MEKIFEVKSLFEGGKIPLTLAPMAGVSDRSMRGLCIEFGADFVTGEMISSRAVHFKDRKTDALARIVPDERPIAIQLFGSEPEIMAEAAQVMMKKHAPDMIDINMGCPVPKVVKNRDGSALMRDPDLAGKIVRAVVDAVPCPVGVKFRAGWDEETKNAPEFARVLEANGASILCIHGRTRKQMYAPPVDLDIIRETVRAVAIPVLGNGGIETADDAVKMLEYTGCAGLAIARGACGSPWIFRAVRAAIEGGTFDQPSVSERIDVALRHFDAIIADKGEFVGVREARKHLGWYLRGMRGATTARLRINASESPDEVREILCEVRRENRDC